MAFPYMIKGVVHVKFPRLRDFLLWSHFDPQKYLILAQLACLNAHLNGVLKFCCVFVKGDFKKTETIALIR